MKYKKIGKYKFCTLDDMIKNLSNSKEFRVAFKEETERLKLVAQFRKAREAKKMTQAMLAKKADMSQSVIARIESGKKGLSLVTLSRVANALGKEIALV